MSPQADKKPRHQCSCCLRKINQEKMYSLYYPLLHRKFWTCNICFQKHIFEPMGIMSVPND